MPLARVGTRNGRGVYVDPCNVVAIHGPYEGGSAIQVGGGGGPVYCDESPAEVAEAIRRADEEWYGPRPANQGDPGPAAREYAEARGEVGRGYSWDIFPSGRSARVVFSRAGKARVEATIKREDGGEALALARELVELLGDAT